MTSALPPIFKRLAGANLAAQSAEQISLAAVPIVAVLVLGAGPGEIGALATAQTLPFLLLSIPAGLLADRVSKRRLMVVAEALRALAFGALLLAVLTGHLSLAVLAVLGFLGACGTVGFSVAAPALVPALVPREQLAAANGRLELARSAAFAAGPALAGALVAWAGAPPAFVLAAVLSGAALVLLSGLPEHAPAALAPRRHPLADLKEGAAVVWHSPLLRPVLLTAVVWNIAWFVLQAAYVPYAVRTLGLGAGAVGFTLATYGVGMVLGALMVDETRAAGAQLVVLLSHNGMDVDLKMASRVRGIDAILGGHTHDGVPLAVPVKNAGGTTLVTNAGSNGKFLGVIDFEVKGSQVSQARYRLLPIFANVLKADAEMDALITRVRAPYETKLAEKLAVTDGLLYRRGNFNGSWDQLLCDALMDVQGAEIAFSPGFRWGTTLLPGQAITRELMMDQLAITYPYATVTPMSGELLKTVLEDVADNLFNPDPYYQQGGDMVRVGGLQYSLTPGQKMGSRISDMRLNGKAVEAGKTYKVAGWAPVAEEASKAGNKPVWDVVETWLKGQSGGHVKPRTINTPKLVGVQGNPGLA